MARHEATQTIGNKIYNGHGFGTTGKSGHGDTIRQDLGQNILRRGSMHVLNKQHCSDPVWYDTYLPPTDTEFNDIESDLRVPTRFSTIRHGTFLIYIYIYIHISLSLYIYICISTRLGEGRLPVELGFNLYLWKVCCLVPI